MKKLVIAVWLVLFSRAVFATDDCVGDCTNGKGTKTMTIDLNTKEH